MTDNITMNTTATTALIKAIRNAESACKKTVALMIITAVYNNGDISPLKDIIKRALIDEYKTRRGSYVKYYGTVKREIARDDIKSGVLTAENLEDAIKFVLTTADLRQPKFNKKQADSTRVADESAESGNAESAVFATAGGNTDAVAVQTMDAVCNYILRLDIEGLKFIEEALNIRKKELAARKAA